MNRWLLRVRYQVLILAAGGLFAFNGCGLSDQQLTSVWQSVLTTALNTLVSQAVANAAAGGS